MHNSSSGNNPQIGDRMKTYERVTQNSLIPNTPVIIRVDGRSFHTLTKKAEKPWDKVIEENMMAVGIALAKEISNVKLVYGQSDEVSLVMWDNKTHQTQPWFGNELPKIISISACIAANAYNKGIPLGGERWAQFDSRAFNLPDYEVTNYFVWRQLDAIRNSVAGLAQAHFSPKQLHGRGRVAMMEMLLGIGIDWDKDTPTHRKFGWCIVRKPDIFVAPNGEIIHRSKWVVDQDIPHFIDKRHYVESELLPQMKISFSDVPVHLQKRLLWSGPPDASEEGDK